MNIVIRILSDDLSTQDQKTIQSALGLASKKDLTTALEKIAKSALLEYCKMISQNGTPSKIEGVREERLFLLIQNYFQSRLPKENEVEQIFHLGSKSRGLLRSTISRYKTRLPLFHSYLYAYLSKATQNQSTQYWEFECKSLTVIDELNNIVKENWSTHEIIKRVPNSASMFHSHNDTYLKLTNHLK